MLTPEQAAFIAAFEANQLIPESFDHEAHLRLAWCYLKRDGLTRTAASLTEGLKAWAAFLGKAEVYHETVTWFFILVIHQRMLQQPEADCDTFIQHNADLLAKGFLKQYYPESLLSDPHAKQQFVLPERWQVALTA